MKDYIPYAVNMNTDNIRAEQLPGVPKYINGISFFVYDEEETKEMVDELFNGIKPESSEQVEQNNIVE